MRIRATIATVGLACGLVFLGVSPAVAESGIAWSTHLLSSTQFDDSVDKYTVCDWADDGMLALGWIEVKQADGSWRQFPKEIVVGGDGHCNPKDVEVLSEDAPVRVWACLKEPAGERFDCQDEILAGN